MQTPMENESVPLLDANHDNMQITEDPSQSSLTNQTPGMATACDWKVVANAVQPESSTQLSQAPEGVATTSIEETAPKEEEKKSIQPIEGFLAKCGGCGVLLSQRCDA